MTSERPYRAALDGDEALRRLRDAAGSQLDPAIVDTLVSVLDERAWRSAARIPDAA